MTTNLSGSPGVLGGEEGDETLVERFRHGDRDAFAALVVRYQRPVYNAAWWVLRDAEDARDVAQNVFMKVAERVDEYDPRYRFFSWLYRIAVNEALNRSSRRKKAEPLDEQIVDRGSSPAETAERSEKSVLIERAVEQLSDSYREVIVLRHWLDLSYDEIADALHVPAKTVKSRLFSARTRLGEILTSMGVEAS